MGRPAKYPEEFRREAVALYRQSDRSRAEVAKSLGIADGSLAAWVKAVHLVQRRTLIWSSPGLTDRSPRTSFRKAQACTGNAPRFKTS